jgi:hypothetical protein
MIKRFGTISFLQYDIHVDKATEHNGFIELPHKKSINRVTD